MKKCDRKECRNFTNIMHENKCRVLMEVPTCECFAFMTKEKKARVEREIKRQTSPLK